MSPDPIFSVPAHVSAITFSDGCRAAHFPVDGKVDCAACAVPAASFIYPPDPAQEQSAANAVESSPIPPASASATSAPAPAPDAADSPAKASKKTPADSTPA